MQDFNKTLLAQLLVWKRDELQDTFDLGRVMCLTRPVLQEHPDYVKTYLSSPLHLSQIHSKDYVKKIRSSLCDIWISIILSNEDERKSPIDNYQMKVWFLRLFSDDGVDTDRDFWNQVNDLVNNSVLSVIPLLTTGMLENPNRDAMCQVVEVNMTMAAYMVLELGLGLCLDSVCMVGALNKK